MAKKDLKADLLAAVDDEKKSLGAIKKLGKGANIPNDVKIAMIQEYLLARQRATKIATQFKAQIEAEE